MLDRLADRVELERRRLHVGRDIREAEGEPRAGGVVRTEDTHLVGELAEPLRERRVGSRSHLAEADEVGVEVEDEQARSRVSRSSRSRRTPSAYVLPEPDWPQRNVWREKPPASSRAGTPSTAVSPISSWARAGASRLSSASTSADVAGRTSAL